MTKSLIIIRLMPMVGQRFIIMQGMVIMKKITYFGDKKIEGKIFI